MSESIDKIYSDLKSMYPGLWKSGYWINPDGTIEIRKMDKSHIENTKAMLESKYTLNLVNLEELRDSTEEISPLLEECIALLRDKIEEFEDHLDRGDYGKYY